MRDCCLVESASLAITPPRVGFFALYTYYVQVKLMVVGSAAQVQ